MEQISNKTLHQILGHLNFRDRKNCRLVCQRWNAAVDLEVGLHLRINDRDPNLNEHLTFYNHVVSPNVTLENLSNTASEFKLKPTTETVVFKGYVNPEFMRSQVFKTVDWKHVSKLNFCGGFLVCSIFDDQTAKMSIFPCLRELHFSLSRLEHRKTLDDTEGQFWDSQVNRNLSRNLKYLLNTIQCLSIRVLSVSIGSPAPLQLRLECLHEFIERHRTLEQIIVRDLKATWPDRIPDRHIGLAPNQLKSLYVSRSSVLSGKTKFFWTELLLGQNFLEDVFLNFDTFPAEILPSMLIIIACRNFRTLRRLTLLAETDPGEAETQELDMVLLSGCHQLEILEIKAKASANPDRPSFKMVNLNQLPKSLKIFKSGFPISEDFEAAQFFGEFTHLEELVVNVALMKSRSHATMSGLRHRRLNILKIQPGQDQLSVFTEMHPNLQNLSKIIGICISRPETTYAMRQKSKSEKESRIFRNYFDLLEYGIEQKDEILERQSKRNLKVADKRAGYRNPPLVLKPVENSISSGVTDYHSVYSNVDLSHVLIQSTKQVEATPKFGERVSQEIH